MKREQQIGDLIAPTVTAMGYEFVGCEYHSQHPALLRVYIDRELQGVTLDDCTIVSRQLSALLDVEDVIKESYRLEVSSPGIERPLFTLKQFKEFKGRTAAVRVIAPIENRKNFKGEIVEVNDNQVIMSVDNQRFTILFSSIAKAKLIDKG